MLIVMVKKPLVRVLALTAFIAAGLMPACRTASVRNPRRSASLADPFVVRPYLVAPGQTTMTVAWTAAKPEPFSVRYGREGKTDRELTVQPDPKPAEYRKRPVPPAAEAETMREYRYPARLTNLEPGRTYRYGRRGGESGQSR
jgi:hypothetical protein